MIIPTTALLLLLSSGQVSVRSSTRPEAPPEDTLRRFQADMDDQATKFFADMDLESRAFLDESNREYQEMAAQVTGLWGEFVPSTRPRWSSYSADQRGHGEVDFENGTVKVEVLVDEALPAATAVSEKLEGTLRTMMSAKNPAGRNAIEGLVDRGDGKPAQAQDTRAMIQRKVEGGTVVRRPVQAADGKRKVVVSIDFKMVPDRLARAAKPFRQLVEENARRFKLDPELILAVIHTESYFNPFARSSAPAFGLMQLVPKSGGRDAWEFVHGTPKTVEPEVLYKPDANIELGSAYLHLLYYRHFAAMSDPEARMLASIAAYNCGPGNTRRALASLGKGAGTTPDAATADVVREALISRTPQETREYVKLVSGRREIWRNPGT